MTQEDNGVARLYVSHLLPPTPKVRAVGGNACAMIPIQAATNANPAVYYAPHGLRPGEGIGITSGANDTPYWPNWLFDRRFGEHTIASVPDANHFTISSGSGADSTGFKPLNVAFTSGRGVPHGAGAVPGQVYYEKEAANGNTVWQ